MLKKYPIALYVTWSVALILFPMPLLLLLNTSMAHSAIDQLILIDAGIIAYSWWLFEVYLSTRPLWLDRLIGLPALYFVHSALGLGALLVGFIHWYYLVSMGQLIVLTGRTAWFMVLGIALYSVLFMSGWLVDRFKIAAQLKNTLQHFFKHQLSLWIHRLNLVAIFLIWIHVHIIGRVNIYPLFMFTFDTYSFVIFGLYLWQKLVENKHVTVGEVIDIHSISPTVVQLNIQLERAKTNFQAGDFFFLSFKNVKGLSVEAHPFSISNAPNDQHTAIFTIRQLGDFTKKLDLVNKGDKVFLEGPFGRFASIIEASSSESLLILIGMGTGIAPLLSIAQKYHHSHAIKVIWTTKNESERYYHQDFEALVTGNFDYVVQNHRLNRAQVKEMLTVEELQTGQFFIVGPASGIIGLEKMLLAAGVNKNKLIDERLTI